MIFPKQCRQVGFASTKPCGDKVYFLSQYLVRPVGDSHEILEVALETGTKGIMRRILSSKVIAHTREVYRYPGKVQLHDRARLIQLALDSGHRCTLFFGLDEHMIFVLDPDLSGLLRVHVYDAGPPRPSLSSCVRELEACGLFGELQVAFCHHILDLAQVKADVYPCRAAGFTKTLDADAVKGGERVAGCLTGSQLVSECYGTDVELLNICPLAEAKEEPFIARCCRSEREGVGRYNGKYGAVVHWGASPRQIADSVSALVNGWKEHEKNRSR
ncbi:MAG: hypothetical protein OS112_02805 [Methanoregula sp.]|nr:MAG: hypothetical protein OS112_02805 [Methanoregula sp.]